MSQRTLADAAEQIGIIDRDLASEKIAPELNEAVASGTMTAEQAALRLRAEKPAFFRTFDRMSDEQFENAERLMSKALSNSAADPGLVYRRLDAAKMNDEELAALEQALRGRRSYIDHSILAKAQMRQEP